MRILVGHTYYQQPGGEDRVFESEAELLEQHGHEVVRYIQRNDQLSELNPLQTARVAHWNPHTFRELRALIQETRPNIAHFHNTFPYMSPSVYDACQQGGVPVVQTLHNYRLMCPAATLFRDGRICEDCTHLNVKLPAVRHGCYRDNRVASGVVVSMLAYHHFRGTWLRSVDRFIAISDLVRSKYIAAGMPPAQVTTKPNAVGDIAPGPGGDYALFVGRLTPEKGVLTMLTAWKALGRQVPLKVVGNGPLADAVKRAEAEGHNVTHLGQKGKGEVAELMRRAAFLVFPSEWHEPFGLVVAEAFAAGTPVIAAHHEGVGTLVEEGETGALFRAGDARDLTATVKRVLGSGALETYRSNARHAYEANFSEEINYENLLDIYNRTLAATT